MCLSLRFAHAYELGRVCGYYCCDIPPLPAVTRFQCSDSTECLSYTNLGNRTSASRTQSKNSDTLRGAVSHTCTAKVALALCRRDVSECRIRCCHTQHLIEHLRHSCLSEIAAVQYACALIPCTHYDVYCCPTRAFHKRLASSSIGRVVHRQYTLARRV